MARVFSIYFSYNGALHSGMVTVRNTPFFREYTLRADDEIMNLLPGDKLISTSPKHLIFQHASTTERHPLTEAILRAVSEYLLAAESQNDR